MWIWMCRGAGIWMGTRDMDRTSEGPDEAWEYYRIHPKRHIKWCKVEPVLPPSMAIVMDHPIDVDWMGWQLMQACLECGEQFPMIIVWLGLERCDEQDNLIQICRQCRVDIHGSTDVDKEKYKALPVPIRSSVFEYFCCIPDGKFTGSRLMEHLVMISHDWLQWGDR
ncbi:hypothetical protein BDR06DRAFT_966809 [Suillus hirtellus]|nr:hypothetical protein BDR06DRAFT_966809 [Suillus hirtellus]